MRAQPAAKEKPRRSGVRGLGISQTRPRGPAKLSHPQRLRRRSLPGDRDGGLRRKRLPSRGTWSRRNPRKISFWGSPRLFNYTTPLKPGGRQKKSPAGVDLPAAIPDRIPWTHCQVDGLVAREVFGTNSGIAEDGASEGSAALRASATPARRSCPLPPKSRPERLRHPAATFPAWTGNGTNP